MENMLNNFTNGFLNLVNESTNFIFEFLSTHVGPTEIGVVVVILLIIVFLFNL